MDSGNRRPFDADHVSEWLASGEPVKTPGKARYSKALIVLPDDWQPKSGVPKTRNECPTERPCPYVRCEWNTWMIDGRDRPGKHRGRIPSVVVAHSVNNCGADVAEGVRSGKLDTRDVAKACGISDRQVRRIVRTAMRKLSLDEDASEALRLMVDK